MRRMPSRAWRSLPGSRAGRRRLRSLAGSRFVTSRSRGRRGAEHQALLGETDSALAVGELAAGQADAVRAPLRGGLEPDPLVFGLAAQVHHQVGVRKGDGEVLVAEAADAVAEIGGR